MTAKDLISPVASLRGEESDRKVLSTLPVAEVLPRLLDAPGRSLDVVTEHGETIGRIDERSMLEGLGRFIAARDDCSTITLECEPHQYSASLISHAVEAADAHLVDIWTRPSEEGKLIVTLRVQHSDPTMAVHSLERYDFRVVEAHGADYTDARVAADRLAALQLYLNI